MSSGNVSFMNYVFDVYEYVVKCTYASKYKYL